MKLFSQMTHIHYLLIKLLIFTFEEDSCIVRLV